MASKDEKFLFNVHVFDEDGETIVEEPPEEDLPPPPPVFSEAQLESARQKAFQDGKAEAEKAFNQSHEKKISATLEVIAQELSALSGSENEREQKYEVEAVNLTRAIFEHLYPHYKEALGFTALETAVQDVLQAQSGRARIRIIVHPDIKDRLQQRMQGLIASDPERQLIFESNETFDMTACKIEWDEGGAWLSTEETALEIKALLQESLAKSAPTRHDKKVAHSAEHDQNSDADIPAPAPQPENDGESDE